MDIAARLREAAAFIEEGGSSSVTPAELRGAADEIEVMRACFNTASRGMSHREVFDLITGTKKFVAEMRDQSNT